MKNKFFLSYEVSSFYFLRINNFKNVDLKINFNYLKRDTIFVFEHIVAFWNFPLKK